MVRVVILVDNNNNSNHNFNHDHMGPLDGALPGRLGLDAAQGLIMVVVMVRVIIIVDNNNTGCLGPGLSSGAGRGCGYG
eukprot:1748120-Karenia_brevis.AAC.1